MGIDLCVNFKKPLFFARLFLISNALGFVFNVFASNPINEGANLKHSCPGALSQMIASDVEGPIGQFLKILSLKNHNEDVTEEISSLESSVQQLLPDIFWNALFKIAYEGLTEPSKIDGLLIELKNIYSRKMGYIRTVQENQAQVSVIVFWYRSLKSKGIELVTPQNLPLLSQLSTDWFFSLYKRFPAGTESAITFFKHFIFPNFAKLNIPPKMIEILQILELRVP